MLPYQAKSKGLLEVTVLVSGDHRRRNVPGAAFRRGRKFLEATRAVISPVVSSPSSSVVAMPAGRWGHETVPPRVPGRLSDEFWRRLRFARSKCCSGGKCFIFPPIYTDRLMDVDASHTVTLSVRGVGVELHTTCYCFDLCKAIGDHLSIAGIAVVLFVVSGIERCAHVHTLSPMPTTA